MSWIDVDLSEVSTSMDLVPAGDYNFEVLPGAKVSDFDANRVEVPVSVKGGEFNGRRFFISYPDPAKFDWSPKMAKRLIEALGKDIEKGEQLVSYLNSAAGLIFGAPVTHRDDKEGVKRADVNIFKIRPARNQ